jgi:DNA-binding NarL/FixJ family response regulator
MIAKLWARRDAVNRNSCLREGGNTLTDKDMEVAQNGIVALTADLMFAARIRGAAPAAVAVHSLARLLEVVGAETWLVLVDLQARDAVVALEQVRSAAPSARVVAFAPHVLEEVLAQAQAAGADRVMTRGAFVRELPRLVRRVDVDG